MTGRTGEVPVGSQAHVRHFGGYAFGAPDEVRSGYYWSSCGIRVEFSGGESFTKELGDVSCTACLKARIEVGLCMADRARERLVELMS